MRILLTSPTYPPFNSGLGNAVAQQAAYLVRSGHEVIVATGGLERKSISKSDGVCIEYFPVYGTKASLRPIEEFQSLYTDFLSSSKCEILIMHAWQNWATDLAFKHFDKLSGQKFVYSHCISTNIFFCHQPIRSLIRYILWRPYWWRLRHIIQKLDGIFFLAANGCDSRFDDLKLARKCRVPLHIVPNSLSQFALEAMNSQREPLENRDRLIAVGSYQWQKGFDFVIQSYAISKLRNRMPLYLFGQDYFPYKENLVSLAKRLKIDPEFIFFHEGVSGDQLMMHYRKAFITLCGSHTECQPLVLIDSGATATPFIARPTGNIVDMPGGVIAKNPKEMARCINELHSNKLLWCNLSDAAYNAAKYIYHPDIQSRNLLRALKI